MFTFLVRLCLCCKKRADEKDPLTSSRGDDSTEKSFYTVRKISGLGERTSSVDELDNIDDGRDDDKWKGDVKMVYPQFIDSAVETNKEPDKNEAKLSDVPILYLKKTLRHLKTTKPKVYQNLVRLKTRTPQGNVSLPELCMEKSLMKLDEKKKHHKRKSFKSGNEISSKKSQSLQNLHSDTGNRTEEVGFNLKLTKHSDDLKSTHSCIVSSTTLVPKYASIRNTKSSEASLAWWSVPGEDTFPEISHGVVHFTASFFQKNKRLLLHVNRLENLSRKGKDRYYYDIILKTCVLPNERDVQRSHPIKGGSDIEVDQEFSFKIKDLTGLVIRISVFDVNFQRKHHAVGHALFYLDELTSGEPKRYRMQLYRQTKPGRSQGCLNTCLSYNEEEDTLMVIVCEGKHLIAPTDEKKQRDTEKLNTYVKVAYYCNGKKVKVKRSSVASTRNPSYNTTFSFVVYNDDTNEEMIVITVMCKGFIKDVPIGRVIFGPFLIGEHHILTPLGRTLLNHEFVSHWFRLCL